jgi:hypothetical protein
LRKYLIVAVAAIAAIAFASVALAQTPAATMDVAVKPVKAGKKNKPKDSTIKLTITNSDVTQTASRLEIWLPKAIKLSTKGRKKCSVTTLSNSGPGGCPKASKIGSGNAIARSGVNVLPNPPQLPFDVTAFLTGSKSIAFYLKQSNGNIEAVAPAKIKKASGKYGAKLDVSIPEIPAQQYPVGNYNGLESLTTTLGSTKKGKSVVKTVGCVKKKHPFKAAIHFVPNPNPPKAAQVTTTATAKCK